MGVIAKRLKQARLSSGLSQERLGLLAGLDEMSASARMNRYETGARTPNPLLVMQLAEALKFPAAFFYTTDDMEADLLIRFHRLSSKQRIALLSALASIEVNQ